MKYYIANIWDSYRALRLRCHLITQYIFLTGLKVKVDQALISTSLCCNIKVRVNCEKMKQYKICYCGLCRKKLQALTMYSIWWPFVKILPADYHIENLLLKNYTMSKRLFSIQEFFKFRPVLLRGCKYTLYYQERKSPSLENVPFIESQWLFNNIAYRQ